MTRDSLGTQDTRDVHSGEEWSSFDSMLCAAAQLGDSPVEYVLPPRPGELVANKYRVHELLGAGGMGAVFRASHAISGREVALKWLLPSSQASAARLVREACATARIDHPNVVDVYDIETHRGSYFLVMELLHGQSLRARLDAGQLEPSELVAIMLPTLRGLAAVHAQGVVHRDLKPDNIFLCKGPDGSPREPKVLDFGISKLQAGATEPRNLTKEGTWLGTPAYMSPEQLAGAPEVDARTDVYAAGVIMYEALTGRPPFRADSYSALVLAIAAQRPLPLRSLRADVPPALERVVLRAMAKRPEDRYADAQALIRALEPWSALDRRQAVGGSLPPYLARAGVRRVAWMSLALIAASFAYLTIAYGARPVHAATARRPISTPKNAGAVDSDALTVLRANLPRTLRHLRAPSNRDPSPTFAFARDLVTCGDDSCGAEGLPVCMGVASTPSTDSEEVRAFSTEGPAATGHAEVNKTPLPAKPHHVRARAGAINLADLM